MLGTMKQLVIFPFCEETVVWWVLTTELSAPSGDGLVTGDFTQFSSPFASPEWSSSGEESSFGAVVASLVSVLRAAFEFWSLT